MGQHQLEGWTPERRSTWAAMSHEKRVELLRDFVENAAADFTDGAAMDDEARVELIRDAALALAEQFKGHCVQARFEQRRRNYEISTGTVERKALPPATEVQTFTIQ